MGSQQRKEDLRDGEKVAGLPNQPSGRKEEVLSKFFDSLLQKKVCVRVQWCESVRTYVYVCVYSGLKVYNDVKVYVCVHVQ